jgi:serine/threonine protein kinase
MAAPRAKVKDVFVAALDKSSLSLRAAFLDEVCVEDAALRQCVEALLQAHDRTDPLLDRPAAELLCGEPTDSVEPDDWLELLAPPEQSGSLGRLGHYEVLEVVGRGGMGVVFRAFDDKLQRVVAIKALAPYLATSSEARRHFVREARATAAVAHDNVIAIHAVEDVGPVPYLVMPFVRGSSLQAKLCHTGALPLDATLCIGRQIAEGLAAAHREGLVHRDINPANILLEGSVLPGSPAERVKLIDFGLARPGDDVGLTHLCVVAGTPLYMSPEQAQGHPVDCRSDLFSLGSVLYTMCTGHAPFRAPTTAAVFKRICEEAPQPVREIRPELPHWLGDLLARLHAKVPTDRCASAREVADLLALHCPAP